MQAGVVWACALLLLRESYPFVILKWKTQRLRKETGNQNLRSALDTGKSPKVLFQVSIIRPLKMLFLSPVVFLVSLLMAICYGDTYLLFTTFDRVFQGQYGFSNGIVGLVYLGSGIGSFLGLLFCGAISDRLVKRLTERNGGSAKPEYRLPAMFVGAVLVPLGLFMYGVRITGSLLLPCTPLLCFISFTPTPINFLDWQYRLPLLPKPP